MSLKQHAPAVIGAVALMVSGWLTAPAALAAQEGRDATLPGPVLLRRIAEAVDGHRTGAPVYVVASLEPGLSPIAVFEDRKAAQTRLRELGSKAALFGPYQTIMDRAPAYETCVHLRSSVMNFRCVPPPDGLLPANVTGLTLLVRQQGGRVDSVALPADADAIFLGPAAVDKFVLPYYLPILGLEGATMVRRQTRETRAAPR